MNRPSSRPVLRPLTGLVLFVAAGCNAILDNDPATYDPAALSTASTAANDAGARAVDSSGDRGATPTDAGDEAACPLGTRSCGSGCVSPDDPVFGCGDPSCEPCVTPHGQAFCTPSGCGVGGCDPGYADCNGDPKDGCEVDLSLATSCGECGLACPAAKPYCAPAGPRFACTNGCAPAAPLLCDTQCVAPQTDPRHCGGCNSACTPVENADVSCADGACTFTCKVAYHACDGHCARDNDPAACGPTCRTCPEPPHAIATCEADACGTRCRSGFGDCNQDPTDGCEVALATNPQHCGACNNPCPNAANAAVACAAGTCQFTCNAGFADCNADPKDGCEVDLQTDPVHCGTCTTSCAGTACENGACVAPDPDAGAAP